MSSRQAKIRKLLAIALVTTFAIGVGGFAFYEAERRDIVSVRVAGELRHTPRDALESAVAAVATTSLYAVDVDSVRTAALTQPWVKDASVRRVWPDSLHIAVVEREPVARWRQEGLLENDGDVFYPTSRDAFQSLPLLEGPIDSENTVLERYRRWQLTLLPVGRAIAHLTLDERGAWRVELDNEVTLLMGQGEAVGSLERLVRVFEGVLQAEPSEMESVDLRYNNGFAVRWKQETPARAGEEQG